MEVKRLFLGALKKSYVVLCFLTLIYIGTICWIYHKAVQQIILSTVIRRELINAIRTKRPEMLSNLENIYLHQHNGPAHTASVTPLELGVLGFNHIVHPPYSPDLASMDFSVFPAIKSELRGIGFENLDQLRSRVMSIIAMFKSDWYRTVFAKWVMRHEKCVRCEGRYFEKE